MEKETIYTNIFIPDEGLLVTVNQKRREDGDEYWVIKFGKVVIFPDRDWLTYLATKIALALPTEEQDKIIEAIGDAENEKIANEGEERILLEGKDA